MHHLGCMVMGVYEGNAADRHQARGRIKRIGQERENLYYKTIYPSDTILQVLLERHRSIDQKNASLETAGRLFLDRLKAVTDEDASKRQKTDAGGAGAAGPSGAMDTSN